MERSHYSPALFVIRALTIAVATLVSAAPGPARAQQSNKLGFKVGDKSRLHLNLTVSSAFDSNSQRRASDIQGTEDVRLIVRPGLALDVPGRSLELRLGLGTTIGQFFGAGSASGSDTTFGLDSNIFLRVGSRKSTVSFQIENSPMLTPTVLPEVGTVGTDERLFPAFTDRGKLFLTFRPGGGALEFDVGYKNLFVAYTRDSATNDAPDDGFLNKGFLEARLKFLPKTAAVFYADFGAFDVGAPSGRTPGTLESNPFSVLVGLIGQITRTISAEVRAGYAETLVWTPDGGRFGTTDPANQRTVVGLASVGWQIIKTAKVSLTYQRDLQPTVALSSFITDAIRLRGNWNIDRLLLGAYGEVQFRDFGTQASGMPPMTENPDLLEPSSTLIFGGVRADYFFLDWLTGGLNYRVMVQDSNDDARLFNGSVFVPALGSFDRHVVLANVGVRY
ncbi:MAG: hypothetical protein AAFZ18_04885 [Myxococcota bacterium]